MESNARLGGAANQGEHMTQQNDLTVAENQIQFLLTARELKQMEKVGLIRVVCVEGNTVVLSVKGGNTEARELCGLLIEELQS